MTTLTHEKLGYHKPKSISEQIAILRELFSDIGYVDKKLAERPVPEGAEGWFAVLNWQKIVKSYGDEAVRMILEKINEKCEFVNWREDKLDCIKPLPREEKMYQSLRAEQKDPGILVLAAQFGFRYPGCPVNKVREVMKASEFGLGAFSVGTMLLTHPERLSHPAHQKIFCAGDECVLDDGRSLGAPVFGYVGKRMYFDTRGNDSAFWDFGSATGFLFQGASVQKS